MTNQQVRLLLGQLDKIANALNSIARDLKEMKR